MRVAGTTKILFMHKKYCECNVSRQKHNKNLRLGLFIISIALSCAHSRKMRDVENSKDVSAYDTFRQINFLQRTFVPMYGVLLVHSTSSTRVQSRHWGAKVLFLFGGVTPLKATISSAGRKKHFVLLRCKTRFPISRELRAIKINFSLYFSTGWTRLFCRSVINLSAHTHCLKHPLK